MRNCLSRLRSRRDILIVWLSMFRHLLFIFALSLSTGIPLGISLGISALMKPLETVDAELVTIATTSATIRPGAQWRHTCATITHTKRARRARADPVAYQRSDHGDH